MNCTSYIVYFACAFHVASDNWNHRQVNVHEAAHEAPCLHSFLPCSSSSISAAIWIRQHVSRIRTLCLEIISCAHLLWFSGLPIMWWLREFEWKWNGFRLLIPILRPKLIYGFLIHLPFYILNLPTIIPLFLAGHFLYCAKLIPLSNVSNVWLRLYTGAYNMLKPFNFPDSVQVDATTTPEAASLSICFKRAFLKKSSLSRYRSWSYRPWIKRWTRNGRSLDMRHCSCATCALQKLRAYVRRRSLCLFWCCCSCT